ncbi:unnamed protein product [Clonostachys byssicola]|uniref:Uncharacterized protein n=1 Tax=Clonostachys byssicola TaxID=160290 RepID=A0A9N9Y5Y1_9HYPO|nr:unnamed protein product [Clonostachys byssicola]
MFAHKARGLRLGSRPKFLTRQLSIKAAYSGSFPATLHHYRPTPTILYDRAEQGRRPHDLFEDSVIEMVRQYYDEMLDREDEGMKVDIPYIFTIRKVLTELYFKDLNNHLHDFFARYAIKEKTDCWLDKHPYSDAFPDTEADSWMRE